ncbi:hypothetical protein SHVI106290_01100 [Shewanella violacea]
MVCHLQLITLEVVNYHFNKVPGSCLNLSLNQIKIQASANRAF